MSAAATTVRQEERVAQSRQRALEKAQRVNRERRAADRARKRRELQRAISQASRELDSLDRRYAKAYERANRTGRPEHYDAADELQSQMLQMGARIRQAKVKLAEISR